ncbi:unnamed protein product (macronuclear) [Paramecium tetraurelia]|uniref:Protein kinase domain-containing protein n=1 Tax=Paramecium tetraurelia TaxID=5888 RepID=A0E5E6_PARTE|nr:uncharacterized protein GSPATT00023690001 [Paramecium tetraurelia]CAK90513.1 unnamed protein product [Paramecium tetraurelia]|eukprot:XP_001457910.1 hypothetical protein (macronuclear) [Paramecium tetraurelia strain d4-2]
MELEKKCGEYIILGTLGKGGFSKVKLAEKDGQYVAIKIFKKDKDTAQNIMTLANEVNILKLILHPNIIKLIDFSDALPYRKRNGQIVNRICIILEYAQGGEFFDYIKNFGCLSEEITRFYFKQLLVSMIFMANKGICHRDLKLENLLLDQNFNLKVADFGLAAFLHPQNSVIGTKCMYCENLEYAAPESLQNIPYDGTKADIYSAGMILHILVTGSPPNNEAVFKQKLKQYLLKRNENLNRNQILQRDQQIQEDQIILENQTISEDLINLICGMLVLNPNNRFSLDQCMQQPWTNGPMATEQQIQKELQRRYPKTQGEKTDFFMKRQAQRIKDEFRSSDESKVQECYSQIIEQYQLNFQERVLTKGRELGFPNEILIYHNPKVVFCFLLKECSRFSSKVSSVHNKKYYIDFQTEDEIDETIKFSVQILDCDNEMIKLNIYKISGDYLGFKEIVNRIEQSINNIGQVNI